MVCRDPVAGEKARQDILSQASPDAQIELHLLDLSRPSQIRGFCDSFVKKYAKLDVLINNAGVLLNERVETPEGLEKTFATNTLGTYLMTTLLLPALENSTDPRVIAVSSGGMYTTPLDTSDLQSTQPKKFDGVQAYAQTKRAQVELTEYWVRSQEADEKEIMFVSMHPGWTSTPGLEKSLPGFHGSLKDSLRTLDEGADTIIWAAMVPGLRDRVRNGAFLFDRKEAPQHLTWGGTQTRPEVAESLVKECERLSSL
jgi:dehydrogenase/reductase SDR family protein 12